MASKQGFIGMSAVRSLLLFLFVVPSGALADRFDDWDKNKDGKLQREELPRGARRNFDRVDTNKDGVISRAEDAAFMARRRGAHAQNDEKQAEAIGFRIEKNLDYVGAGHDRQTLDLFLPKAKGPKSRPLLVFIHGGAWLGGSKEGGFRRLMPYLRSGKYVGASLNYRLSQHAIWPAQIHDCKAAIRWLKANASKYGYDAERIGIWGTSAGGHLVAMLGVAGDVSSLEGQLGKHLHQNSKVTCVVNYFGPANLLTMDDHPSSIKHNAPDSPESKLVGGAVQETKKAARNASPVTHVSEGDAPILNVHGTNDKLVPYAQSVEFSAVLKKAKVPMTFITMKDAGHGFRSELLQQRVATFFGKHLLEGKKSLRDEVIEKGK